jgi:hypothetical protein
VAIVNQVEKRAKLSTEQVVQFQLLTHCFLSNITLSVADLKCLTMLALDVEQELNTFCNKVHQNGIFKSAQSVRNAIIKAEKNGLILKEGKSKKKIWINPSLAIQVKGNIFLDYKFLAVAPQ